MTLSEAHDEIRWNALDGLAGDLRDLLGKVEALRDALTPPCNAVRDTPANARQVRRTFDALDAIGWCSTEQAERAGEAVAS